MTKTDERLRTAIVGLGWVGTHQGRAIAEHPRGEVTAVCDLSEEQMKKFAEELEGNPKFYTDYEEMCRDSDIDAEILENAEERGLDLIGFFHSHPRLAAYVSDRDERFMSLWPGKVWIIAGTGKEGEVTEVKAFKATEEGVDSLEVKTAQSFEMNLGEVSCCIE